MFKTRLISGIVLVILAVALITIGGNTLAVALGVISIIGLFELYRIQDFQKKSLGIIGYGLTVIYYWNLTIDYMPDSMMFVIFALITFMFLYVFTYPKYHINKVVLAYFGVFYVSVMLSFIYKIRILEQGKYLVWLIFLCSWGSDTCAYCVGVLFGKHKMAPVLSPKKSMEGAIGGIFGASILTYIYATIFLNESGLPLMLTGVAAISSMISMIGDLNASAIKRNYEIKDYGTLIPGHGGILDRFDSVIVTAPIIYFLCAYLV